MSIFNLVVAQEDLSVPADNQQYTEYGYVTHHRLLCSHAKYYYAQ